MLTEIELANNFENIEGSIINRIITILVHI